MICQKHKLKLKEGRRKEFLRCVKCCRDKNYIDARKRICPVCKKYVKLYDFEQIGSNYVVFHLKCYEQVIFSM